jgi:site-specific recombinase XerC
LTPAAADTYLSYLAAERRLSPHTLAAARRDLDKLIAHAAARPLDALSVDDIRRAIVQLRAHTLSLRGAPGLATAAPATGAGRRHDTVRQPARHASHPARRTV